MNPEQKSRKKQKQKQKKIVYKTLRDPRQINRDFIQHFNYRYWQHKANALYEYVVYPEKIRNEIRYEYDNDLDESIIENFKMEIHMQVFHSSETLFLVLFGFLYEPESIPIWMARCSSQRLHELIKKLSEEGLEGFIQNSNEWLKDILYPSIDKTHKSFEDAKFSTKFTKNYLKRLAEEYIDHIEYNSYKHGLRCNVGQSRYQMIDEKSQEVMIDSKSDTIVFLELDKIDNGKEILYKVKESSKTYDLNRDAGLIQINTQILSNIFDFRQLVIKRELVGSECKIKFLPYFYKTDKVSKLFDFDRKGAHGGFVTRFSIH